MLNIKNLTKVFHNRTILDSISLSVNRGEIALLLGKSGVGKSTLLRILSNLEQADNGVITLNNNPLTPQIISQQHLVGMVFQNFNLFAHLTALQNITLALENVLKIDKESAYQQALSLLTRFEIAHKANSYPSELSGGQKQRLALARALALKPNILCLDEPTSALDPFLTTYVAKTIQSLAHDNYIIFVATHDTTLLDKLDCSLYLMENGKIIESAQSKDFIKNKKEYPNLMAFVAGNQ
jgi:polar amino acid transport system ATP-binding protein